MSPVQQKIPLHFKTSQLSASMTFGGKDLILCSISLLPPIQTANRNISNSTKNANMEEVTAGLAKLKVEQEAEESPVATISFVPGSKTNY
jgi:hypothetical protein